MARLETCMGCSILVTSSTTAELLQAFRDEDEFFGLTCEEHPITPESDPDEEELHVGGSDAEDAFIDVVATFDAL